MSSPIPSVGLSLGTGLENAAPPTCTTAPSPMAAARSWPIPLS
ncbi:Uncharacterised protein [Mycobacteroides abscessus subsp. abscessus]|nr:Uncharacterised protein [Mycobacteroides abscessus subsp. abscessus]